MNKEYLKLPCNLGITHQAVHGKWKFFILRTLAKETLRFGELHRKMPFVRQGYLTQQLKELEKDGLVHREVYKQVPPKVEYSLTDIGRDFVPILEAMEGWGKDYRDKLEALYPDEKIFSEEDLAEMSADEMKAYFKK